MSTAVNQKTLTVAQRTAQAAEVAARQLDVENAKLLGAVLLEAALDELRTNPGFEACVRSAYEAALPKRKTPASRQPSTRAKKTTTQLTPIQTIGGHQINIAADVDPYYLYARLGAEQLPVALGLFTKKKLVDEVWLYVKQRHPNAKLPSKATLPTVVETITAYVIHG